MRYRKKPVIIEAVQVRDLYSKDEPEWALGARRTGVLQLHAPDHAYVNTLEGRMLAEPGDWIIRGVKGELYPCKPDIFALTYEAALDAPPEATPVPTCRECGSPRADLGRGGFCRDAVACSRRADRIRGQKAGLMPSEAECVNCERGWTHMGPCPRDGAAPSRAAMCIMCCASAPVFCERCAADITANKGPFPATYEAHGVNVAAPSSGEAPGERTIRELQTSLPWTIRYSRDYRANPQPHKDFAHAVVHVTKAMGKLSGLVDDMDHDREVADDPSLRERHAKYVADLVVCALRMANTFPGGVIDLERAVVDRITTKNATPFTSPAEVSCRCGLYVGACPLHDHDYRTDAENAIEADRAARAKGQERR